jgi:type IX secretion system PorP/SprF family membrane protein
MKKNIFILSLLLFFLTKTDAQQSAQYTIYMYNPYGVHPAYAGAENSLVATGVIRQQWAGLLGSPASQQINAHLPLNIISSGFGINIENDKAGAEQLTSAAVTYAYRMRLNKQSKLAFAINGGLIQGQLNGDIIRTPEGKYDKGINHNDNFLPNINVSAQAPLLDASVFFQSNTVKIGFTAKNLLSQTINYTINANKIRLIKNYLFTFATDLKISNNFTLQPSLLLRSDFRQLQSELSVMSVFNEKISLGASYRGYSKNSNDALALIGGFRLNDKVILYYSYDISLSPLKTVNTGSHEIVLRYNLAKEIGKGRPEKIIYNPRYY